MCWVRDRVLRRNIRFDCDLRLGPVHGLKKICRALVLISIRQIEFLDILLSLRMESAQKSYHLPTLTSSGDSLQIGAVVSFAIWRTESPDGNRSKLRGESRHCLMVKTARRIRNYLYHYKLSSLVILIDYLRK